jgi:hypothetical protein
MTPEQKLLKVFELSEFSKALFVAVLVQREMEFRGSGDKVVNVCTNTPI